MKTEVRFFAPNKVPAGAEVLTARATAVRAGIIRDCHGGGLDEWKAKYGPSPERTVAARVKIS